MTEPSIPIQHVEKPIICSPYQEPDKHWLYDRETGIPHQEMFRRPASYWYKVERTGTAQQRLEGFGTQEESEDLPLVNILREDVQHWRNRKWQNAT
ncbi:MAG: hypothetical protein ACOYMG_21805, partial [Candidatus Methylumidiphilus sp.]